jgi:hypothetical protein
MFRTRAAVTCAALALTLGASTAALAPAALASAGHAHAAPAGNGKFSTWAKAQKAAGFNLKRPTNVHGLTRTGKIQVATCEVTGSTTKRDVGATYGKLSTGLLSLDQNNSGHPCGDVGDAKLLATPRINGAKAQLFGACGMTGEPPCSSKRVFLFLIWKKGKISFVAQSHQETRAAIISFARSLVPVG